MLIIIIKKVRNTEKLETKNADENFKSECDCEVIDEKINCRMLSKKNERNFCFSRAEGFDKELS